MTSVPKTQNQANKENTRYAFNNGGPVIKEKGPRLVGNTLNNNVEQSSLPMTAGGRPEI